MTNHKEQDTKPGAKTVGVRIVLFLIVLTCVAMVVTSAFLWWPNLANSLVWNPGSTRSANNPTETQEELIDQLKNYNDRVSDLQKLVSTLLAISALYTLALGLGSWASAQGSIDQAQKLIERAAKSVQKIDDLIANQKSEIDKLQKDIRCTSRIALASVAVSALLPGTEAGTAEMALNNLRDIRTERRTDPFVNMYIGRLYKALKRYENAAQAMTTFIEAKEADKQGDDKYFVTALFNRACYESLAWEKAGTERRQELYTAIESDLKRCFRLDDQTKKYLGDSDFDAVKDEPWFKKLTQST